MADKNGRTIKSFQVDPDVIRMLERAGADGFKLRHVINSGVREWLTKKGYDRKKNSMAQEIA